MLIHILILCLLKRSYSKFRPVGVLCQAHTGLVRITQMYSFIKIKTYVLVMAKSQSTNICHISYYQQHDFHLKWLCRALSRYWLKLSKRWRKRLSQATNETNIYANMTLILNKICCSHYNPQKDLFIWLSSWSFEKPESRKAYLNIKEFNIVLSIMNHKNIILP